MSTTSRRSFLKETASGIAAASVFASSKAGAAGANERVRVAVIGCGNQGKAHMRSLSSLKNVEIVNICDVDKDRLAGAGKVATGAKPVTDFRRILDDNSI